MSLTQLPLSSVFASPCIAGCCCCSCVVRTLLVSEGAERLGCGEGNGEHASLRGGEGGGGRTHSGAAAQGAEDAERGGHSGGMHTAHTTQKRRSQRTELRLIRFADSGPSSFVAAAGGPACSLPPITRSCAPPLPRHCPAPLTFEWSGGWLLGWCDGDRTSTRSSLALLQPARPLRLHTSSQQQQRHTRHRQT